MDTHRSDPSIICCGVQKSGPRRCLRCFIGQGGGILSAVVGSWLAKVTRKHRTELEVLHQLIGFLHTLSLSLSLSALFPPPRAQTSYVHPSLLRIRGNERDRRIFLPRLDPPKTAQASVNGWSVSFTLGSSVHSGPTYRSLTGFAPHARLSTSASVAVQVEVDFYLSETSRTKVTERRVDVTFDF